MVLLEYLKPKPGVKTKLRFSERVLTKAWHQILDNVLINLDEKLATSIFFIMHFDMHISIKNNHFQD